MANRFPLIFNSGAGQIQELAASDNLDLTSSNLVNAGILFTSSGSATAPSLQIGSGTTYNPGLYSPGTDQLAVATNGTVRLTTSTTAISSALPIDVPLGAVGTPSFTFTGDLNTGFYSPAADTLAAVTAGSNRLHITSGGLVGIGTSSVTNDANLDIQLSTVPATDTYAKLQLRSGNYGYIIKGGIKQGVGGQLHFDLNNNGSVSTQMVLDTGGRLGIGTTGPGGTLDIKAAASTHPLIVQGPSSEFARIDSSGRLLVGTSSKSATASTTAKGVIGLGGGGSFICAEGQVANNGTIDITVSTGGLHYFTGLLQVNNINASTGSFSTQSLISVLGSTQLGTITTSTLHTANGGGGQSFTITYVAIGILRLTNTSGSTCNVQISYMGGGTNAS